MKKSALPVRNICGGENRVSGKEALVKLLRWHFGHREFRGKQLEAIQAVLSGRDCFCLMPTGGGKSICYQIPAMVKPGIVLVVSPLIALMENQVMALKDKGIAAEFLSSIQTSQVKDKIHEDLDSGQPSTKLLYVTPELIATPGFMSKLMKIHARGLLNLIAIDEAHCISSWGHDFRPSYRKLSSMRTKVPGVPMMALTATAAPKVQIDVIDSLCLQNPLVLRSSFNRPNIYYEVRYKDLLKDSYADLCDVLKSSEGVCAIIYCLERTTCDELSTHLSMNGISSAAYHAGLNNKLRSSVLDDWISSKIQVVVATVAFGMGIDRKDVRIVCHFNIPKSMEAFYQESGRAGRDQLPSRSVLYYGIDDRKRMEFILSKAESKKLQSSSASQGGPSKRAMSDFIQMVEYCEGSGCRREKILETFGEQAPVSLCKKSCDACKYPSQVSQNVEELTAACSAHARNRNAFSHIVINSSKGTCDDANFSEFWNRDDEASGSGEDISDSDGDIEFEKSNVSRKLSKTSRLSEKIEFLQRAEENYYRTKTHEKQVNRSEKAAVSETLRQTCKQRLLDALKQVEQRLGDLKIDLEASSSFLENECFKKYGKTGKSFYNSQIASSLRWLSSSTSDDIKNRFSSTIAASHLKEEPPAPVSNTLSQRSAEEAIEERESSAMSSRTPSISSSIPPRVSETPIFPAIPSFSEFVNSRKSMERRTDESQSPNDVPRNPGKKMRLQ